MVMIYNDKISTEYGSSNVLQLGQSPIMYRPTPNKQNMETGILVRSFAKKANEDKIIEVDPSQVSVINKTMYMVVFINWKITGSKYPQTENGIITKTGVIDSNNTEIDRVKTETGVDLSKVLTNPLEYWRGY